MAKDKISKFTPKKTPETEDEKANPLICLRLVRDEVGALIEYVDSIENLTGILEIPDKLDSNLTSGTFGGLLSMVGTNLSGIRTRMDLLGEMIAGHKQ